MLSWHPFFCCSSNFSSYSNPIKIYKIGKYGSCEDTGSHLGFAKKSLDSSTIEGFFVYECLKLKLNFARLCIPNFFSVLLNGSVRAELAHTSHVENSFFSPSLCIEIFLSDFFMTFYIAAEIG